jgi:hypothetical protein
MLEFILDLLRRKTPGELRHRARRFPEDDKLNSGETESRRHPVGASLGKVLDKNGVRSREVRSR